MIKINGIETNPETGTKIKVQLGGGEFLATARIANRRVNLEIRFEKTWEFSFISNAIDEKYNDSATVDWGRHGKSLQIDADFPWDESSRKILRSLAVANANQRFKKHVVDTGLLEIYKKYKKQGAKLVAGEFIRESNYRADAPHIRFSEKPEIISYSERKKKIICTEKRRRDGSRYGRTYDHVILSGNTVSKFTKKLERYWLNKFLGIDKKALAEEADED